MPKHINDALVRDFTALVHKHSGATGREFQHSALHVAHAFYEQSDVDTFFPFIELIPLFTELLQNSLSNADYEALAAQERDENGKQKDQVKAHVKKQQ